MQEALELARNPDTPAKEPATTLAANVIGQMPALQWVLVPAGRSQAEVSSWTKACQSLPAAPIQPRDHTPHYGNPGGGGKLAAAVASSQAVTTKAYHPQPSLKLPTPPGRQVLPAAKKGLQVRMDTAGCQDIVANFYHKNKEKVGPYLSFRIPEDWEPVLIMLSCKKLRRRSSMLGKGGYCHGSRRIKANTYWRAVPAPPVVLCSANNHVFIWHPPTFLFSFLVDKF